MKERISALLVCAGQSSRMGGFKPLMKLGDMTVVERSVNAFMSFCDRVVVVTGKRADEVESALLNAFGEKMVFVRNEAFASTDMLCSVRLGLSALPSCEEFFLQPADIPLVSSETLKKLIAEKEEALVIFPSYHGRRGHPALLSGSLIPAVLSYRGEDGMRGFFRTVQSQQIVEVDDEGILLDLDAPDDFDMARRILSNQLS